MRSLLFLFLLAASTSGLSMCQFYPEECHWECEHIINYDPYYPPEIEYECYEECFPITRQRQTSEFGVKGGAGKFSRIITQDSRVRTGKHFRMKFKDAQKEYPSSELTGVYDSITGQARKSFAISQSCISNGIERVAGNRGSRS